MGKRPKLKVIRSPDECCTRSVSCKCKHDKNGSREDNKCPWWINHAESGYCFWRYLSEKSSPDGVMKELVQSELAQLFGYSNTKTHFVLKQAIDELKVALVANGALEFLDYPSDEADHAYHGELDLTDPMDD